MHLEKPLFVQMSPKNKKISNNEIILKTLGKIGV